MNIYQMLASSSPSKTLTTYAIGFGVMVGYGDMHSRQRHESWKEHGVFGVEECKVLRTTRAGHI